LLVKVSIVLPAHNEAAVLPELMDRLDSVLGSLGHDYEVICVDDGSTDGTWEIIERRAASDPRYRGLRLSRNFGHQIALTAGLWASEGDAVITMDADTQHPPEVIPALLAKAGDGFDVVTATRRVVDAEGWFKVASARFFYRLLNRLTALDLPNGGADFRYMSRTVVDAMLQMPERHRFLRGMARWVGYRHATVEYERALRPAGESKYTLRRMIRFAWDAIVGFSALPLRIASVLGLIVSMLGGLYAIYVIGVSLFTDNTVPGWTSVVVAVLVLGGVQLACIGIIGQYLGRMYEEIKGRPLFIVWEDTAGTRPPHPGQPRVHARGRLVTFPEGDGRDGE
jgi:glycosyltransferase involved in cell wall biosynthesis